MQYVLQVGLLLEAEYVNLALLNSTFHRWWRGCCAWISPRLAVHLLHPCQAAGGWCLLGRRVVDLPPCPAAALLPLP